MPRTFDQILYDAAYATGTLKAEVISPYNRSYGVSLAKALACYMARKELSTSFSSLTSLIGFKDRTEMLKAFNRISVGVCNADPQILKLLKLASYE